MPQHFEKIFLPYTKEQLCDLVLDIEKYPEFLPWCNKGEIIETESENILYADLEINFKAFTQRYTSKVIIDRDTTTSEIKVEMVKGPFKTLDNKWKFIEDKKKQGCYVEFSIKLELKSFLLNKMLTVIFDHAYKKMLSSFQKRAKILYKEI